MEEQFVTYEIALKLKELGFKEKCFGYYCYDIGYNFQYKNPLYDHVCDPDKDIIAPLWQQALSWLEFNEYFDLCIIPIFSKDYKQYTYHTYHRGTKYQGNIFNSYQEARQNAIEEILKINILTCPDCSSNLKLKENTLIHIKHN